MSLTIRYCNGHDVEGPQTGRVFLKYEDQTSPPRGAQGQTVAGWPAAVGSSITDDTARAWWLFNTGFRRAIDAMSLGGSFGHVVFRCNYLPRSPINNNMCFLRFEDRSSGSIVISLRQQSSGVISVFLGGDGRNAATDAILLGQTSALAADAWIDLEVRIDAASGRVRIWIDEELDFNQSGLPASSITHVSFHGEAISRGYYRDNIVIATDTGASDTILGPLRVVPILLDADYQTDSTWMPSSGADHVSRINDSVATGSSPLESTYLQAEDEDAGEELFQVAESNCEARIYTVAVNVSAIGAGASLEARVLQDGARSTIGDAIALDASRAQVRQRFTALQGNGEPWHDGAIRSANWGFQPGEGSPRVISFYLEKVQDATGLAEFDCGGGNYII